MDASRRRSARITGVILAAGSSVRMGRPKQLLPLAGEPVLQHVLDAAAASSLDELLLVLGHQAADVRAAVTLPSNARSITNPEHARGLASSLVAGMHAAAPSAAAIAVLLGDQPSIGAGVIERVLDAYRLGVRPIARPVYVASDGARTPGHPVVIDRALFPEVERLAGDEGMRALLAAHPDWVNEVDITGEPPPDVDTPEQYARLRTERGDA